MRVCALPLRATTPLTCTRAHVHTAVFTVLMSRSEPECAQRLPSPVEHSEIVSVPLPADAGTDKKFLAFPPDGEFELWLLTEIEEEAGKPDFMAEVRGEHEAVDAQAAAPAVGATRNPVAVQ